MVILENKELEILNSKIPSRAKSQRKSFAQKIHEPSLNLSMNNNNLTKTEKIYKLISKFYIIKKFVKYLRNAAYVRFPTKYEINRMDVLNDLSFFKEGLSLKQFQNEKKMIYCSDSYMLLIKLKFFCCKIFEFLVNRMGQYFTVFDPSKTLRSIWDALHLLVLSFYFFKIPIELSFDIHFFDYINEFNENISIFLNYFCIFFILLDIFFNFNTGYYKKGSLIAARKNIAKHYIKSGFFFDVASFIPLFLDFQKFGLNEYWNMLIFLRISTFFKIFSKIEESIHINFKLFNLLTLLKVVARIVLLSHLFACGWHAISLKYLNSTSNTW